MNQEVKNVFTPGPIVSFKSAGKISSYLVSANIYALERAVGSKKCDKSSCAVCFRVTHLRGPQQMKTVTITV